MRLLASPNNNQRIKGFLERDKSKAKMQWFKEGGELGICVLIMEEYYCLPEMIRRGCSSLSTNSNECLILGFP